MRKAQLFVLFIAIVMLASAMTAYAHHSFAATYQQDKKITIEEMQGGSFTITNLGGIGGVNFSPIVNSPEVAILGVARAARKPVFVDGKLDRTLRGEGLVDEFIDILEAYVERRYGAGATIPA